MATFHLLVTCGIVLGVTGCIITMTLRCLTAQTQLMTASDEQPLTDEDRTHPGVAGTPIVLDFNTYDWAFVTAAVNSAPLAGKQLGQERDILRQHGNYPVIPGLLGRLSTLEHLETRCLPVRRAEPPRSPLESLEDRASLHVTDVEFSVLVISMERAIFHGLPCPRVRVGSMRHGDILDVTETDPSWAWKDEVGRIFRTLLTTPDRPTVQLDNSSDGEPLYI